MEEVVKLVRKPKKSQDPDAGHETVWLDGKTRIRIWKEAEKRGISRSTIMWEVLQKHFREK